MYSIVYIYLINSRLDVTTSVRHHFRTRTLSMSKLNPKTEDFFQQPNPRFKHVNNDWYKESLVGINTIAGFMKSISKSAGLSYIYTNHSVRGSTINAMKRAGYSLQDITFVSKQKKLDSLKSYLRCPSMEDRVGYSNSFFAFVNKENSVEKL